MVVSIENLKNHSRDLGTLWDQITTSVTELSVIHSDLAIELQEQIEKGFRNRTEEDEDWLGLKASEVDLTKLIKDYEDKNSKFVKQKSKKEKIKETTKGFDKVGKWNFFRF